MSTVASCTLPSVLTCSGPWVPWSLVSPDQPNQIPPRCRKASAKPTARSAGFALVTQRSNAVRNDKKPGHAPPSVGTNWGFERQFSMRSLSLGVPWKHHPMRMWRAREGCRSALRDKGIWPFSPHGAAAPRRPEFIALATGSRLIQPGGRIHAMRVEVEAPKIGKAPFGRANRRLPISPGHVAPAPFGTAAASPGSEPERLSAEVPGSDRPFRARRPIERFGRRSWSIGPSGTYASHCCAAQPSSWPARHSELPRKTGAGERSKRVVRLALAEPFALSQTRCSMKRRAPSRGGISSCVECGDCGTKPTVVSFSRAKTLSAGRQLTGPANDRCAKPPPIKTSSAPAEMRLASPLRSSPSEGSCGSCGPLSQNCDRLRRMSASSQRRRAARVLLAPSAAGASRA